MRRKISFLLLSLLMLLGASSAVFAASETVEVTLDQEYTNAVFQITWENAGEEAAVEIESPAGAHFGNETTPELVTASEGRLMVNVGAAPAGIWKVTVTGTALGAVEVGGGQVPDPMDIDAFLVAADAGGLALSWEVTGTAAPSLSYTVFADSDGEGFDGVMIGMFSGPAQGTQVIAPSNLECGLYHFYLQAEDGTGVFDMAYMDGTLLFLDPSAAAELSGVSASAMNGDIYVSYDPRETSLFRIVVYDAESGDLVKEEVTEEASALLTVPEGVTKVQVGAASYQRERMGRFTLQEIDLSAAVDAEVVFPEKNITNQTTIPVTVSFSGACRVDGVVNEELLLEGATEPGTYQVNLLDGENTLVFLVTAENGAVRSFQKELYVDSTPPQLSVKEDIDQTVTDQDAVYLEGYSEAGAMLFCNGQEVEMVGSYFSIRCPLETGDNEILLTAEDVAGNQSRYQAIVTRTVLSGSWLGYLIVGAVFLLLLIIYLIVFVRGARRKRREKSKKD